MFTAIQNLPLSFILAGIIWSVALGFAVGNYACSLVHRLPRGRLILDRTPYCGHCGTALQVRDLFPVFSALSLRHRCRYCGTPFPVSHTWTELLVGLLFVLGFLRFGFGEQFVLIAVLGTFLITLAAIEANDHIIMGRILLCVIVSAMVLRTLADHSIYGFFFGGLYALIMGAIIWRKDIKKVGHIYALPPQAQLLAAGGIAVGEHAIWLWMVLFTALYLVFLLIAKLRKKLFLITIPLGLAVMAVVLYL